MRGLKKVPLLSVPLRQTVRGAVRKGGAPQQLQPHLSFVPLCSHFIHTFLTHSPRVAAVCAPGLHQGAAQHRHRLPRPSGPDSKDARFQT